VSTNTPLAALQHWLVDRIVAPCELSASAATIMHVRESGSLDAAARIAIYEDGYFARLTECLRDDFPLTADFIDTQLESREKFADFARAYALAHPSRAPNLNMFGARFVRYLHESPSNAQFSISQTSATFCADLAALEWALVEVLHARAAAPLPGDALAAIPAEHWTRARFEPSAAVRLLAAAYPANSYFQQAKDTESAHPMPLPLASATLVYRTELTLWRMPLTPPMHVLLAAILRGETLMDAMTALENCITSEAEGAEVAAKLGTWFRDWAQGGVFERIVVDA
jgi:hypothetical protein